MRKTIAITLIFVLVLSLAACGGNSTPSGGSSITTPPAATNSPAVSQKVDSDNTAKDEPTPNDSGWHDITSIAAGNNHTVGLKKDGTVLAVGRGDSGSCDVSGWTDIAEIWAGGHTTLGMKLDGTYIMTGDDKNYDFSDFIDIKEIAVGTGYIIGLKNDGTCVVTEGNEPNGSATKGVEDWSGIAHIAVGGTAATSKTTVGIMDDGTCVITGLRDRTEGISEWKDIVAVTFNSYQIAGLKKDGTLTGIEEHKQYNGDKNLELFQNWTDIVEISGGSTHMVGLKKDGTVFAVGENKYGECDVQ